jgi:hypothetical protein
MGNAVRRRAESLEIPNRRVSRAARQPWSHPRVAAGVAFLALQCALVVGAQFQESRDFSWAPHTSQVSYALRVEVDGRELSTTEIAERYGIMGAVGWEAHSYRNLINLISQYERTYGRADDARVHLQYRINGGDARVWDLPAS